MARVSNEYTYVFHIIYVKGVNLEYVCFSPFVYTFLIVIVNAYYQVESTPFCCGESSKAQRLSL